LARRAILAAPYECQVNLFAFHQAARGFTIAGSCAVSHLRLARWLLSAKYWSLLAKSLPGRKLAAGRTNRSEVNTVRPAKFEALPGSRNLLDNPMLKQ